MNLEKFLHKNSLNENSLCYKLETNKKLNCKLFSIRTSCGKNGACKLTQIALQKSANPITKSVNHCLLVKFKVGILTKSAHKITDQIQTLKTHGRKKEFFFRNFILFTQILCRYSLFDRLSIYRFFLLNLISHRGFQSH